MHCTECGLPLKVWFPPMNKPSERWLRCDNGHRVRVESWVEPIEDDEGPGLVETPEAQQAEAAAEPSVTEAAEKPKSSRSRSRTRKPKAEKAEGGEGGDTPEAPAEAPQAE